MGKEVAALQRMTVSEHRRVEGSNPSRGVSPKPYRRRGFSFPLDCRECGFEMPSFAGIPAIRKVSECRVLATPIPHPAVTRAAPSLMSTTVEFDVPSRLARGVPPNLTWFRAFRERMGNFSLGLQPLTTQEVQNLCAAAPGREIETQCSTDTLLKLNKVARLVTGVDWVSEKLMLLAGASSVHFLLFRRG